MRDGWTYQPGRHGPTVPQLTLSTLTFAAFILFVIITIVINNEGNHDDDDYQIGRGGKENDMEHWQSLSASASSKTSFTQLHFPINEDLDDLIFDDNHNFDYL